VEALPEIVELGGMRECAELEGMPLLQRGQRLSVQPVSAEHFAIVCQMGGIREPSI